MTNVQKLVHLAMRQDDLDVDRIRVELLGMRRRAYEDELTIQARRVGCPGCSGRLENGPILSELNAMCAEEAAGIVNTYNYDLAASVLNIAAEVPTANRYVYAKRLQAWEGKRSAWKAPQIAEYTEGTARSKAQQDFYTLNNIGGVAELMPKSAVCPVCIGWVERGEVPLREAENNPGPWHPNCPHLWQTSPDRVAREECPLLWMGE
jgi:hypothetical protein